MNLPFLDENTDRVHGKKVKTIIVKFKYWKFCHNFHNAKPKPWTNNKQKPDEQ